MSYEINTIVLCFDFSEKSVNALRMGIQIALRHDAKIIIYNAINTQYVIDRTGRQIVGSTTLQDNYDKTGRAINNLKVQLKASHPKLKLAVRISQTNLMDGLNELIATEKADLVLCGSSGEQNFMQTLLGSVSYQILTESVCSVIMVPEFCGKYTFEHILVPVRVSEELTDKILVSVAIAEKNDAVISLLGVSSENDRYEIGRAYLEAKKILHTKEQNYECRYILSENSAEQISKASEDNDTDIIILNYKDENQWKSFFAENFFKKVIKTTETPLFFYKPAKNTTKISKSQIVESDITLSLQG
ncbi:universal stress protein [Chryseobacterium sp.]|uniref:universal stress protein n=1 Tax=Chryseobacterium sp. TaxID=1871047 RepID=UPI00289F3869|nr:universal stress protein [Chryseobacterium sp.]